MTWQNDLPELLREAPYIANAKDPEEALQQIRNAAKLQGQGLHIPTENAGEEAIEKFYETLQTKVPDVVRIKGDDLESFKQLGNRIGIPESVDDYTLPDGEWDAELTKKLGEMALDMGMTKAQFRKFMEQSQSAQDASNAAMTDAKEADKQTLRSEWGEAYDVRLAAVKDWMQESDSPLDPESMSSDQLKWAYNIAEQFAGDQSPASGDKGGLSLGKQTPEEMVLEISDIMNNPEYFKNTDAARALQTRRMKLEEKLAEL